MTSTVSSHLCLCGGPSTAGDRWCGYCGRLLSASAPRSSSVPATITAARVLLGLSLAGDVLGLLVGLGGAVLVASIHAALPDDGSNDALRMVAGLVVLAGIAVGSLIVTRGALRPIGEGDPAARTRVTMMLLASAVGTAVAAAIMGAGPAEVSVQLLIPTPGEVATLVLLWLPASSRRHFGDQVVDTDLQRRTPPSWQPSASNQWSDPPTVRLPLTDSEATRASRSMPRFAWLGVSAAIALVVVVIALSASGSALAGQAEGTWTCTALGDEDQDVYGNVNQAPFEVYVGHGTFSIPSRFLSGSWSVSGTALEIHSTWSKVPDAPQNLVQITDLPDRPSASAGTSPTTFRSGAGSPPAPRALGWSYTPGHLHLQNGMGIADTGVDCTKQSDSATDQ